MELWNLQTSVYLTACLVFLYASQLVRSIFVFYLGGVFIGLCTSFLFFGYFLQRIIPIPRITKIPLFFGGWPLSLYIYFWIWTNFGLILQEYRLYAFLYLSFFTLLSLAVCYRIGPPVDKRTLNLAEWLLQLISLAMIYLLSQDQQRAITAILTLVLFSLWRKYPGRIQHFIVKTWRRLRNFIYGPEPRRFLTEEEYREESRVYTQRELEKLRHFCQTQDSRSHWKLIPKLKRPNRLASFVSGDSEHVSPDELSRHSQLYEYEDEEEGGEEEELSGYITDDG